MRACLSTMKKKEKKHRKENNLGTAVEIFLGTEIHYYCIQEDGKRQFSVKT